MQKQNIKNSSQPKKSAAKSGKTVKVIVNKIKHAINDCKTHTKKKQIQMTPRKTK